MRTYNGGFKIEAVKLAAEIGTSEASRQLDVPMGTLYHWIGQKKNGTLTGAPLGTALALNLADENKRLKQKNRELERVNKILREASAFFAASQKK